MMKVQLQGLPIRTYIFLALSGVISLPCLAEITLDGTLGPSGPLPGPDFAIPATVGEQVGPNLFHSFGVFNINTGESATFTGPGGLDNVIGRVTGGESSTIDGALNSTIPGADLYLINPAGMMFGPDAQLNVPGSFHVSTADYVRLGKGGMFSATHPQASTLTVAPPSAFGFLDANVAPIHMNNSGLAVPPGETFSLVGGNIRIAGGDGETPNVSAPSGRINFASVASTGEVKLVGGRIDTDAFARLGNIRISRGAGVDTSGTSGGTVFIRGGQLAIDNGFVTTRTIGSGNGGLIDMKISGDLVVSNGIVSASTSGEGAGGTIKAHANNLMVINGGLIISSSFDDATGDGGAIEINASDEIQVFGTDAQGVPSGIAAFTSTDGDAGSISLSASTLTVSGEGLISAFTSDGMGDGGAIKIEAGSLLLLDGGGISNRTLGFGNAGMVQIDADKLIIDGGIVFSGTEGSGKGGNISIDAKNARLLNGGQINGSSVGLGRAGNVTLAAAEDIFISGSSNLRSSGILSNSISSGAAGNITVITNGTLRLTDDARIQANTLGTANAGNVTLRVRNMTLTDGAQIATGIGDVQSDGTVQGDPNGTGRGGEVQITVMDTLTISDIGQSDSTSGLFANAQIGRGKAGDILVTARRLNISDGGIISSSSSSDGNAGNIVIEVANTAQLTNGGIGALARETDGGNITLTAASLQLTERSVITSMVGGGMDTIGGNVTVNGGSLVILDGSEVIASAGQGQGGNITINSDVFLSDGAVNNVLNASSDTLGNDGTVEVNSPDNDIAGSITKLPASFLNAAALLSRRCAARDADETSSFVIVGRGGVPHGPDDWALSSYGSTGTAGGTQDVDAGINTDTISDSADASGEAPFKMLTVNCAR